MKTLCLYAACILLLTGVTVRQCRQQRLIEDLVSTRRMDISAINSNYLHEVENMKVTNTNFLGVGLMLMSLDQRVSRNEARVEELIRFRQSRNLQ